jgi:hypothetical protein
MRSSSSRRRWWGGRRLLSYNQAAAAICSPYLLGVGGRGLFGGGPGHGGRLDGAGPLKLYPSELKEVGSLGLTRVCEGAGIVCMWWL